MMPDPVANHRTPGMHIWGWMSPRELEWLGARAATMRSVVEVGALHGRSSYALAAACPGPVYCVDPWADASWNTWNANVGNVLPNAYPVRGLSPQVGERIPDPVDMVFLDGAHDRASVTADIGYWWPRTQVLLCGHDYGHSLYPDVKTVVDELLGRYHVVEVVDGTGIWALPLSAP